MAFNSYPLNLFRYYLLLPFCRCNVEGWRLAPDRWQTWGLKGRQDNAKGHIFNHCVTLPRINLCPQRSHYSPNMNQNFHFSNYTCANRRMFFFHWLINVHTLELNAGEKRKLDCSTCTKGKACMLFDTLSPSHLPTCHLPISPAPPSLLPLP